MDSTILTNIGSSKHAGSRSNPVTALFAKVGEASTTMQSPSFLKHLCLRRVYIPVAGLLIVMLVLGGIFVLPSLLFRSPVFPALCSGNFQSAHTTTVPTPATSTSPDEGPIALSEGATIFDLNRNQQEVQYKLQAAKAVTTNDSQKVVSSLQNAIRSDQTDAEAQIYLEDWQVLTSRHPHITLAVGTSFPSSYEGASRDALQGAFTVQKECNDRYRRDNSKTQIVLMIANVGGDNPDESAHNATFLANQIVDQAGKDPTIVGIMGWPRSSDSINVNHQLRIRNSNLPMLAACSASGDLTGAAHFYRICPTDEKQAQMAANFLLNTKQKKRIAILYQKGTSWSENLKREFVTYMPKAKIVAEEGFSAGDPGDIQSTLNKVLAQKPDALFFAGYPSDFALLKALPLPNNLVIMGGSALSTTNAYTSTRPDLNHVYFASYASPNEWEGINPKPPFFHDYQQHFGTHTAPIGLSSIDAETMNGYDGTLTLLYGTQQVLSKKNTIAPSDLESELKNIKGSDAIQGVTGRIAFDSNGDQDEHKMVFIEHIAGNNLVIDEQQGCLLKDNCSS